LSQENESHTLGLEAAAFDAQIEERVANGHVPDIRLAEPCDYFRNNPWRRPEFVRLDFGEQCEVIRTAIRDLLARPAAEVRILEVGCGPGYLSLELARFGFNVTGLDISGKCIEIANRVAENDPWKRERGMLNYIVGDFNLCPHLLCESFDVVVFLGALHHFPDQAMTLARTKWLLRTGGLVVAHEPVRDRVTRGSAAFAYLLGTLLSASGKFYESGPLPIERAQMLDGVDKLYRSLRYEDGAGDKVQSINDNEAGYAQMYPELSRVFKEELFQWRYAFFHEFIGGLRFAEGDNALVAHFLREMDSILVETGVLNATEFLFVGRKVK
jgi:2-polyprenyl-3-methyl-5-hydroxy-6-metoxy-1,4-benzoquinol methylase